jgi:hypothetical protein
MMNWEVRGTNRSWPILSYYSDIYMEGQNTKTSLTISGLRSEIRTQDSTPPHQIPLHCKVYCAESTFLKQNFLNTGFEISSSSLECSIIAGSDASLQR